MEQREWVGNLKLRYKLFCRQLQKPFGKKNLHQTNEPTCIISSRFSWTHIQLPQLKLLARSLQSAQKDIRIQWYTGGWASIVHTSDPIIPPYMVCTIMQSTTDIHPPQISCQGFSIIHSIWQDPKAEACVTANDRFNKFLPITTATE